MSKGASSKSTDEMDPPKGIYRPETFAVRDMDEAKRIILTPEPGTSTEERWEKETPFLVKELIRCLEPTGNSLLIDYGCGVGRLAKELIEQSGCSVIGVDIRAEMRALANTYVDSDRFSTVSPIGLLSLIRNGLRVNGAFSVWVLQHCAHPAEDIALIDVALRPRSRLYVVNGRSRCIPTNLGWARDDIDIGDILSRKFKLLEDANFPRGVTTEDLQRSTFCRLYEKSISQP